MHKHVSTVLVGVELTDAIGRYDMADTTSAFSIVAYQKHWVPPPRKETESVLLNLQRSSEVLILTRVPSWAHPYSDQRGSPGSLG
jgi:hypothetical protein